MRREIITEDGVLTHMIDIISCDKCHKKYKDHELIEQIKCVVQSFSNGKSKTAGNLLDTLYNNSSNDRSTYLFLIVLALFCSYGYHQEVRNVVNKLSKQSAEMLAKSLSEKLLNSLPENIRKDMISICRLLSNIIFDKRCPFEYVNYFLHFFGHETGFQELQELSTVISEGNYHNECCSQLCVKWYDAFFEQEEESESKVEGIFFILESIKPESVVFVYDKLKMPANASCTIDEKDIDLKLKEKVKYVINRSIKKCKRDLEAIIELSLVFFRERFAEKSEFCEMFENAIIERFGYVHLYVPQDISRNFESLIEKTNCFSTFKQQDALLNMVIDSDNKLIFNLFIELFRCERIRECYSKLNLSKYKDWLERYPKQGQPDLAHILQRFIDITELTHYIERNDVESLVVDISMEDLQRLPLEVIFQNLQTVWHFCEGNGEVSNLLIRSIEKNINRIDVSSFELLAKMIGTERKLIADYRIAADIICAMMKHFLVKQSDQTDEDYFIALEKQVEFLKAIKGVTGKYQHHVKDDTTYKESMACITGHVKKLFELKVNKILLKHFKQSENSIKLLQLNGNCEHAIKHQINSAMKIFDNAIKEMSSLSDVVDVLLERKMLILQTTRLKEKSDDILRRISQGELTSDECNEDEIAVMLGCNKNTLGLCKEIDECIKSETFWNLGKHIIDEFFAALEIDENGQTLKVEMLLQFLKEEGMQIFQSGWLRLDDEDTDLRIWEVNLMFKGSKEIRLYEQGLNMI
ncbi:uncharacterized protein LOC132751873 [Ruditapes philippinarum]|uniref:uncharacterized protein LOC132751873 n=1 Tax=Ruditapes philippinarum TaxID=129788 RepID=UPI00295ABE8A|nr:uncharacterized protein LOC132751873 [Ruditapes philippinarum]